jgi:hypothetical protein
LSNKELKKQAYTRLNGRWGTVSALMLFKLAFLLAFVVAEMLLYEILKRMDIQYSLYPSYVFGTHLGRFMVCVRLLLICVLFLPEFFILHRIMTDIYLGRNFVETRTYIQYNVRRLLPKIVGGTLLPLFLRLFVLSPLGLGIYGIYYWGWKRSGDSLTTLGLFIFMISIGFTIVWAGVFVHYSISLKLTKYILALNPRANVFDACDLSVRLMEGQHMRYIGFLVSFIKFLPLAVLIYPALAIEPVFRMSEMAFAQDVMGNYWQDKMPAMIHRWRKYADRAENDEQ